MQGVVGSSPIIRSHKAPLDLEHEEDQDLIKREILREADGDRESAAAVRDFLAGHVGW